MNKIISEGRLFIFVLVLTLAVLPGCSKKEETGNDKTVSGEKVKKETKEAMEAASSYTLAQIQTFRENMDKKLTDYGDKIEMLQENVDKLEGDAKTKADQQLQALRMKYGEASEKLDELKNAGTDVWEQLKSGSNAAMDDLSNAYNKAAEELGKP